VRQAKQRNLSPSGRSIRWYAAIAATLAMVTGVLVSQPSSASAANISDGFDHTNIVSDAQFYDGNAMTASQVEKFLKERVTRCAIGDAGKKPGQKGRNGNPIAKKCLRDFSMTTQSRAADAYCGSYAGGKNESAATIIAKVGKACGISQRTLLIMLEKEQSLVTSDTPTTRMYDYAMGWACPDSGPGNSANCDPDAANFFTQVYKSAWQFKVYLYKPGSFGYHAGKKNTVQYHPDKSCGTSTFTIKNNATAGLYIYTPYRPNAAALKAGWGTGDKCSTYGNRNFYNFWKSWFGSTNTAPITGDIAKYYNANNGPSRFGQPTGARKHLSENGSGYVQHFERGMIMTSMKSGDTFGLKAGPFMTKYEKDGGPAGDYGWLAGVARCEHIDEGCDLPLQFGEMWYSKTNGAHFVPRKLMDAWNKKGRETGSLGYPTADGVMPDANTGYMVMQKGTLMISKSGALHLNAAQSKAWKSIGGYAKAGVVTGGADVIDSAGQVMPTQKGNMYLPSGKSAVYVGNGAFADAYKKQDGPRGSWGWPTKGATCGMKDGGCVLPFEKGTAVYSKKTNVAFTAPAVYNYWKKNGSDKAAVGYPVKDSQVDGKNTWQKFQNAGLAVLDKKELKFNSGPFMTAYEKVGGPSGDWGWPTATATCGMTDGGCTLPFDNGVATYSKATGVNFITLDSYKQWKKAGADKSNLGYPTEATKTYKDGFTQRFQKAMLAVSSDATVRIGNGPFLDTYIKEKGAGGSWGWPKSVAVCGLPDSGCTLDFTNGVAKYTKTHGVKFEKAGEAKAKSMQNRSVQEQPEEAGSDKSDEEGAEGDDSQKDESSTSDSDTSQTQGSDSNGTTKKTDESGSVE
jgi:uncharacterized protein with LGFP repeats